MINEKQAKKFCKEDISKIENYEQAVNDTTQVWDLHHRTAIWWNCTAQELIDNECYYNRKACELIFLTHAEHSRLHNKGKTFTEETRRKISEANKGRKFTEETRRKLSEAHKGRTLSKESRRKISEAQKGHIHSEESRKKISEAHKGRTLSEETRKKISEAHKGKPSVMKGRTLSEESRIKISEAQKLRWAAKKNLKKDIT